MLHAHTFPFRRQVTLGLAFVSALAACASSGSCVRADDELKTLIPLWKAHETEVSTAYLKYKRMRYSGLFPLSSADLDKLLAGVCPEDSSEPAMRKLAKGLLVKPNEVPQPWTECESWFEGTKVKEREGGGAGFTQVYDGKREIVYDPRNKQVNLMSPGASRQYLPPLSSFRSVPPADDLYRVQGRSGGRIDVFREGKPGKLDVSLATDASSGIVRRRTFRDKSGKVVKEIWQDGLITYPGGVVFPSRVADANYNASGGLTFIIITILEEARFNFDLPADTFSVGTTGGVTLFDQRDSKKTYTQRVVDPVSDVVQLVGTTKAEGRLPWLKSAWWVAPILVAGAALLLFFRARRTRKSRPA